jgi:DNA gyrase subunit B
VIHLSGEKENIKVEMAMFYGFGFNTEIRSYVNNFAFGQGGSHCEGALAGVADTFNEYLQNQENDCEIIKRDVMEGLYAVINVNNPNFAFDPNTPEVNDKNLEKTVKSIVKQEFGKYLSENPDFAKKQPVTSKLQPVQEQSQNV